MNGHDTINNSNAEGDKIENKGACLLMAYIVSAKRHVSKKRRKINLFVSHLFNYGLILQRMRLFTPFFHIKI